MSSDIHALSGAYAIDALDDVERARFERHLAECEACREEVDSLREVGVLLAGAMQTAPPPELRDRVLTGISQVRPLPPVVPQPAVRRSRRPWALSAAAAAVVLAVGAGVVAWEPWEDPQAALTATERVLEAPDAEHYEQSFPDGSTATVVRSPGLGRAVIVTDDMAPPPEGKVFQVWLQDDSGDMLPAGVMPVQPDATVLLEGDAGAADGAGITVEPEGGSPEPTSEPVALFSFGS